jgi:DNA-binding GntR family transcriptional regulator
VLGAVAVCAHDPADALARLAGGHGSGLWPDCLEAHARVLDDLMDAFDAAHPELVAWVEEMLDHDLDFRARFRRAAGRNILAAVHTMLDLARHPQRWQQHEPGERWPHGWPLLATLTK